MPTPAEDNIGLDPARPGEVILGTRRGVYLGGNPNSAIILAGTLDRVVRERGPYVYDLMWHNGDVKSSVMSLVTPAFSEPMHLTPAVVAEEGFDPATDLALARDIDLASEIALYCGRLIDRLSTPFVRTLKQLALGGMKHGASLAQKTYEVIDSGPDKGRMGYRSIRVKPRRSWNFVIDPSGEVLGSWAMTMDGPRFFTSDQVVTYTWGADDDDPRGMSILRDAFEPWHYMMQIAPQQQKYLNQFAEPSLVIEMAANPEDVPATDLNGRIMPGVAKTSAWAIAERQAKSLQNGSYMILPSGAKAYILEANTAGEAFINAEDQLSRKLTRAILYTARATMEAKNSSKADGGNAKDIVDQITESIRCDMGRLIEDHVLYQPILMTWGKDVADRLTPRVDYGAAVIQDRPALWNGAASLIKTGVVTHGMLVKWLPTIGVPAPEPPDDAEPKPTPAITPDPQEESTDATA